MLLAGCRWMLYASVLGMVGVAGAQLVFRRVSINGRAFQGAAHSRTTNGLAVLWLAALLATLAANILAWFGPEGFHDGDRIHAMLFETRWGQSWVTAVSAAIGAIVLLLAARRFPRIQSIVLGAIVLAAIVPTPLLGHAAGKGTTVWLLHSIHLLGTGLWLGTVLIVAMQTWPHWRDRSDDVATLPAILAAITPVALLGAAVGAGSGVWIAALNVWPPQTVLDTAYGRTLALKTLVVAVIATIGWLNWRRFGPGVSPAAGKRRLRFAVITELALGFLAVLALTAWLSGLPPPE